MFALLRKIASKSAQSVGLLMIVAATATVLYAQEASGGRGGYGGGGGGGMGGGGGGGGGGVPEIDPSSIAQALTFLTGSVLLLTDKIRRK